MDPTPDVLFKNNTQSILNMALKESERINSLNIQDLPKIDTSIITMAIFGLTMYTDTQFIIEKFIVNCFNTDVDVWDIIYKKITKDSSCEDIEVIKTLIKAYPISISMDNITKILTGKDSKGNKLIRDEVRKIFFKKVRSLISNCILYIHNKRSPYSEEENGKLKNYYDNNFMGSYVKDDNGVNIQVPVDIKKYSDMYKVKLIFPE